MESWITKFNKESKALSDYYESLYNEDIKMAERDALEYFKGDKDKAKAFVDGYLYSIKQPHTRTIHLIELYVMDFFPKCKKIRSSDEHIINTIRDIFRKKLYPKGLFDE